MKKALAFWLSALILLVFLASCTQQQRAKKYGGTATIDLSPGKKLITATWKNEEIWYLVEDMKSGDFPRTLEFHESSKWGLMQGKVIFKEHSVSER